MRSWLLVKLRLAQRVRVGGGVLRSASEEPLCKFSPSFISQFRLHLSRPASLFTFPCSALHLLLALDKFWPLGVTIGNVSALSQTATRGGPLPRGPGSARPKTTPPILSSLHPPSPHRGLPCGSSNLPAYSAGLPPFRLRCYSPRPRHATPIPWHVLDCQDRHPRAPLSGPGPGPEPSPFGRLTEMPALPGETA